jgi:hypothetical protein
MRSRARRFVVLVCLGGLLLGCPREDALPPAESTPSAERALTLMQGSWRSTTDASVVLEIEGDRVTSLYDGEVLQEDSLAFVDGCPGVPGGEGPFFTLSDGGGQALCYHLTVVDDGLLEYTFSARGNTLAYTRIE